jgi:hypothetical protein
MKRYVIHGGMENVEIFVGDRASEIHVIHTEDGQSFIGRVRTEKLIEGLRILMEDYYDCYQS